MLSGWIKGIQSGIKRLSVGAGKGKPESTGAKRDISLYGGDSCVSNGNLQLTEVELRQEPEEKLRLSDRNLLLKRVAIESLTGVSCEKSLV